MQNKLFIQSIDNFRNAESLEEIKHTFNQLLDLCDHSTGLSLYHQIVLKTEFHSNWCKEFKQKIDAKLKQVNTSLKTQYESQSVVVVGAGPGGLVTALECALMGATVNVIEKRTYLTRNNILHLWPWTMKYLISVGAKIFYPKFGTGGMDHIGTKQIQRLLIKINLLLGVKLHFGFCFEQLYNMGGRTLARCSPHIEELPCTLLVGADGVSSTVANSYDFHRTTFTGSLCIGMTFNFKNYHSKEEVALREFALASLYNPSFFKQIQDLYNIRLENLVYYQGETHYFVMTIKKNSLFDRGVFKDTSPDQLKELLDYSNIFEDKLLSIARDTATFCGIPQSCEVLLTHQNKPDVQIFDFSDRIQSDESIKMVEISPCTENSDWIRNDNSFNNESKIDLSLDKTSESPQVIVTLVGDALIEPFWPLGTGCNRAILSALDAAWLVNEMAEKKPTDEIVRTRQGCYLKMKSALVETFTEPFKLTVNPFTRYNTRRF